MIVEAHAPTGRTYPLQKQRRFTVLGGLGGAHGRWAMSAVLTVNVLVLTDVASPVRATAVLPLLLLLPGQLTLRALRLRRPSGADALLHAVAVSLLWLLAISFVLAVLPVSGALSTPGCLIGFDVVAAALAAAVMLRDRRDGPSSCAAAPAGSAPVSRTIRGSVDSAHRRAVNAGVALRMLPRGAAVAVGLAGLAVVLSVAGAARLNAGGGSRVTELAFTMGAAALLLTALSSSREPDSRSDYASAQAAAAVVFLVGLAMLLATSLRGTGVTGHDIKLEFRVFQETLASGSWRPGAGLADYNACLSITTLPSFLYRMLGVAPLDVFRICFQLIFAVVPVGVLLIARRVLPAASAVLAAGLFIAFPTFVNDMPMLNRQEIALVFFTVATYTLLEKHGSRRQRTVMFAAMIAGLTVSHYSSTYVTAGMILVGWLLMLGRRGARALRHACTTRWQPHRIPPKPDLTDRLAQKPGTLRLRRLEWFNRLTADLITLQPAIIGPRLLAFRAVAIVLIFSASWSVLSGSGSGLIKTAHRTVVAMESKVGTSSDAVGYSFFQKPQSNVTDAQALREFTTSHGSAPTAQTLAALDAACPTRLLSADTLPISPIGRALATIAVAPAAVNQWSRRGAVMLFELGALLGAALLWVRTRWSIGHSHVLAVLNAGALVILGAAVVLPQLSVDYGLLRLYQQLLVVLAPAVVLALIATLRAVAFGLAGVGSAAVVTGCLITTSGLLPQVTGGYPPQLNLNNAGGYYHAYYASASDLAAVDWMDAHLSPTALVSADSADTALLRSMTRLYPLEGVAPGIVPTDAYLEVTVTAPEHAEAVAISRDRILVYTFPLSCVAAGRPLLYSHGDHRIYGPIT